MVNRNCVRVPALRDLAWNLDDGLKLMPIREQPFPPELKQFADADTQIVAEAKQHVLMSRQVIQHPAIDFVLDETLPDITFFAEFDRWKFDRWKRTSKESIFTASFKDRRNAESSGLIVAGFAPFSMRASM